ncbi:MAG: zinc-dependent alcohol dehydrogenase family protein [Myxococcales bacterium]
MRAMLLDAPGRPLRQADVPPPTCGPGQLLLRVSACGVCRTDLHLRDGELPHPKLPLILGHQIVGRVVEAGDGVAVPLGERMGVPWLGATCGACRQCRRGRENLCERARFTGYTVDGGFAELAAADARFCFPIPPGYGDAAAAPLLCAGFIGYRALRLAGDAELLGLYGFGAAGHLVAQLAHYQKRRVFAFTRPGDLAGQALARRLGAEWAGGSDAAPPEPLDAAILFAPVGELVPRALAAVGPGGRVVCAGIHMSDIPSFPYRLLWEERCLRSVANLERRDGRELLELAPRAGLAPEIQRFPLERAEDALAALRAGEIRGAAVLTVEG